MTITSHGRAQAALIALAWLRLVLQEFRDRVEPDRFVFQEQQRGRLADVALPVYMLCWLRACLRRS